MIGVLYRKHLESVRWRKQHLCSGSIYKLAAVKLPWK